jgi:hypothetical protein
MAPVLQCPDCGTKHPLASIADDVSTFPCRGCGRKLKVPESVPGRAPAPAPAAVPAAAPAPEPAPAPAPEATRAVPVAAAPPDPTPHASLGGSPDPASDARGAAPVGSYAAVPWWARLLLWIVAVPVAYFVVFLFARVTGLFTSTQLSDVFLANGVNRFWPVVRILPFVALVTAAFVQGGVMLIGRRKAVRQRATSR